MSDMNRTMQEALRLMQSGDLRAATQALQRGLGARPEPEYAVPDPDAARTGAGCIEAEYRVVDDRHSDDLQAPGTAKRRHAMDDRRGSDSVKAREWRSCGQSPTCNRNRFWIFIPSTVPRLDGNRTFASMPG